MSYQRFVKGEEPFRVDGYAVCIGATTAGYSLYHASVGRSQSASSATFQPFYDAEGTAVEVDANHPLTIFCAPGTWFKLKDNADEAVPVTY